MHLDAAGPEGGPEPARNGARARALSPVQAMHRRHVMSRFAWALASLFLLAGLAGCNTIEGAGEDIERAGEEIEDAADG